MRVLLLHPEDNFPPSWPTGQLDLIVDFGRAPSSTYQRWASRAGCRVTSIFDLAQEVEDIHLTRELFRLGGGRLVDRAGIDWWDVLSPLLLPDFGQALLLRRLAKQLEPGCHLYASRPDPRAMALQSLLGAELSCRSGGAGRQLRHFWQALSRLNFTQVAQICQDKFDPQHSIRRRVAPRKPASKQPVVLLPSAYINVSRTATSYAALLPDQQFLLVLARREARLKNLPPNVSVASLDSYYGEREPGDTEELLTAWQDLQAHLASQAPEFALAQEAALLARMPTLIRWGLAARDAWGNVFTSENISACFSADDANPYTSLPLILARSRQLPTLACHHGAMDYRMGIKALQADFYMAKGELERDYLVRQCRVSPEKILVGCPQPAPRQSVALPPAEERPWLVFFTEPYAGDGWRLEEVYQDLLPALLSVAQACGLRLVFKLHPFESVEGHRRLLRRFLSPDQLSQIEILAGPLLPELWQNTRFAVTAQSTVAMEAAALRVPAFLCAWLRSPWGGYVQQYARFGIGRILKSADGLSEIPSLLKDNAAALTADPSKIWHPIDPAELRSLLVEVCPLPAANAS